MAKRGAVPAMYTFTKYEKRMIARIDERIDRGSSRKQVVVRSMKSLTFTTCTLICRNRKRKRKLMN